MDFSMDKPQDLMLPDSVLKFLVCSLCQKYLSVRPIKVYPRGIITCGRCQDYSKSAGYNSFLNEVIEKSFFPCVNRYEGCQKALKYDEVVEHEKYCEKTENDCPVCPYTCSLSTYELLCHFKSLHSGNVLSDPEFILVDTSIYYLYCDSSYVFLIHVQVITDKAVIVTARTLGPHIRAGKVWIQFYSMVGSLISFVPFYSFKVGYLYDACLTGVFKVKFTVHFSEIWTKEINYSPLHSPIWTPENCNIFLGILKKIFGKHSIYVCKTRIFESHYPNLFINSPTTIYDSQHKRQISLVCELCQQFFVDNLCFCFNKYLCGWCAYVEYSYYPNVKCDEKLTKMYSLLGIKCRYGCEGIFNLMSYVQLKHEDNCNLRPLQKCPVKSCKWKGKMSLLEKHFIVSHPRAKFINRSIMTCKEILDGFDDIDEVFMKIGDVFVNLYFETDKNLSEIFCRSSFCPINNTNDYILKVYRFSLEEFSISRDSEIKQPKQPPHKHVRVIVNRKPKSILLLSFKYLFMIGVVIIFYNLFAYKMENLSDLFFNYTTRSSFNMLFNSPPKI